jgi:hypothetical protein
MLEDTRSLYTGNDIWTGNLNINMRSFALGLKPYVLSMNVGSGCSIRMPLLEISPPHDQGREHQLWEFGDWESGRSPQICKLL